MQTAIIVVLAVLVVVLAAALAISRTANARPTAPPSAPPPGLSAEASALVALGKPIHAIKLVREQTGWSLAASKAFVDRLGGQAPRDVGEIVGRDDFDDDELERQVRVLLGQGKVVHAVKLVRETTGWGLADAKRYVDDRRR